MEPQLFRAAVEQQLTAIQQEKQLREEQQQQDQGDGNAVPRSSSEMVLYQRMSEIKETEHRAAVEDLLYVSVLEKFMLLGVDMLPRLDGHVDVKEQNLASLTNEVYSKEALQWVREHLREVMGPATLAPSQTRIRVSKLQMAQMYAGATLFGYFLRKVDRRFHLDRSLGFNQEDAVERLEALFRQAQDVDDAEDPDQATQTNHVDEQSQDSKQSSGSRNLLKEYVDKWDQESVLEAQRLLSVEAAEVVQRQTTAVCGDVKELMAEMRGVIGTDAISYEEVMQRVEQAVNNEVVQCLTMTVATQRRGVLEAVAFGCFLRDVETWVDNEYSVLTPISPGEWGPQQLLGAPGPDDDDPDGIGGRDGPGGRGGGGGGVKRPSAGAL